MLRRTSDILNFTLGARDGEIGRVKDFYFDDQRWPVRYLVVDTGKWLEQREVLISPFAVRGFRETDKVVEVKLTREQIKGCPSIDTDAPVSRQYEREYYQYYGWPFYWEGPALWGPSAFPAYHYYPGLAAEGPRPLAPEQHSNPHLRSTSEVSGYHLEAPDGEIGHVEDFIFDDQDWVIQYLVVDTRNWWPGKKVLVSPAWATAVDWDRSRVQVSVAREAIRMAPEYNPTAPLSRDYEVRLFEHYHRHPYWERRMAA